MISDIRGNVTGVSGAVAVVGAATVKESARAEADTAGEAASSMTASPDELSRYVAMIELEALVEQYNALEKKARDAYRGLDAIRYRINDCIQQSGIKLPFHCNAGTIRRSYANERYGKPRKYRLRAEKNGLIRSKRLVVLGEK